MPFETFDLGRVIQTAEAIKTMKRAGTMDKLQEQYLGQRIQAGEQEMKRQARADQVVMGKEKAEQVVAKTGFLLQAQDLKGAIEQREPVLRQELEKQGIDWATIDDATLRAHVQTMQQAANVELGKGPTPQLQTMRDESGAVLQRDPTTGALKQVVAPQKPDHFAEQEAGRNARAAMRPTKPVSQFRPMSPEEVAAAGLPAGSSAQKDDATGKIDVLSKRDQTATLSQKDQTIAKMKLNTVKLARQQLDNIRQKFEPLRGTMSAGAFGQGKVPTKEGRLFDSAVNQMRSTLTALTRVPGVGAMSDYETKLDQSKFPTRNDYEEVTADQITQLDNMLNAIETGYTDLMSGGQQSQQTQQTQERGPVGISNDADYAALPSGTQYRAPDGSLRTKR